jgi:predicted aconitase
VIEGIPATVTGDQLKAFCASAASSGAVALFHAVGVTPEANTLEEAFQGGRAEKVVEIRPADWRAALAELSTADQDAKLDLVVLGCPHYSFAEFGKLTELIRAARPAKLHPGVEFIVITSGSSYALLERTGWLDELTAFGVRITLDTCVFHTPIVHPQTKVVMTDSGKCAYYCPGELNVQVALGSMGDCVRSAVEGRVRREDA